MNPFEGYVVYGPYLHKGMNRRMINLVSKVDRTTISYAKYLMSMKLGRWLSAEEEVDHIDDDTLNDSIDNLQILTRDENVAKYNATRQVTMLTLTCGWCGESFEREAVKERDSAKRRKLPACCNASHAAKLQHASIEGLQEAMNYLRKTNE